MAPTPRRPPKLLQDNWIKVKLLYFEFESNSNMLLPCHHYSFQTRLPTQRLALSYNDIQCWLWSVFEASLALQKQEAKYQADSQWFFPSSPDTSYTLPPLLLIHRWYLQLLQVKKRSLQPSHPYMRLSFPCTLLIPFLDLPSFPFQGHTPVLPLKLSHGLRTPVKQYYLFQISAVIKGANWQVYNSEIYSWHGV